MKKTERKKYSKAQNAEKKKQKSNQFRLKHESVRPAVPQFSEKHQNELKIA